MPLSAAAYPPEAIFYLCLNNGKAQRGEKQDTI